MGWQLIAAAGDLPVTPVTPDGSQPVIVALITALGAVVVALIAWATTARGSRTSASAPPADPKLGERIAVVETHDKDDRKTLAQLDRHVDGIGDVQDQHGWRLDRIEAWITRQGGEHL